MLLPSQTSEQIFSQADSQVQNRQRALVSLLCCICVALFTFMILGCGQKSKQEKLYTIHGKTMGTTYTVKWVDDAHDNEQAQKDAMQHAIETRLEKLNQSLSTYIPDSEIMRFNAIKPDVRFKASKDLFETLSIAQGVSEHSKGAFDATVSPLIDIWGFGANGRVNKRPTQTMIDFAKTSIGYQKLKLNKKKQLIEKLAPVTIDLSAVAKGYAVDSLATTIEHHHIYDYMVEIGGEVFAKGFKPNAEPWVLGIEKPIANDVAVQKIVKLANAGLATSGDYRNYFEDGGIRYSHTIDPTTGAPISHRLASVSVLHKTCAEADAYATAIMVLGEVHGVKFAKDYSLDALFLVKTANGFEEITTGNFKKYVLEQPKTKVKHQPETIE